MDVWCVYILFLVQEAKELAEIQDIKHSFMVCGMPVMDSMSNNINDLYHIGHKI